MHENAYIQTVTVDLPISRTFVRLHVLDYKRAEQGNQIYKFKQ